MSAKAPTAVSPVVPPANLQLQRNRRAQPNGLSVHYGRTDREGSSRGGDTGLYRQVVREIPHQAVILGAGHLTANLARLVQLAAPVARRLKIHGRGKVGGQEQLHIAPAERPAVSAIPHRERMRQRAARPMSSVGNALGSATGLPSTGAIRCSASGLSRTGGPVCPLRPCSATRISSLGSRCPAASVRPAAELPQATGIARAG